MYKESVVYPDDHISFACVKNIRKYGRSEFQCYISCFRHTSVIVQDFKFIENDENHSM